MVEERERNERVEHLKELAADLREQLAAVEAELNAIQSEDDLAARTRAKAAKLEVDHADRADVGGGAGASEAGAAPGGDGEPA